MQYPAKLSAIYNALAAQGLARQHAQVWDAKFDKDNGILVKQDGPVKDWPEARRQSTDTYRVWIASKDPASAETTEHQQKLETLFKNVDYVKVDPPKPAVPIGPRS